VAFSVSGICTTCTGHKILFHVNNISIVVQDFQWQYYLYLAEAMIVKLPISGVSDPSVLCVKTGSLFVSLPYYAFIKLDFSDTVPQ
jgi:hypothetical protein